MKVFLATVEGIPYVLLSCTTQRTNRPNQMTSTYPVYKNAKGNTYACGKAEGDKNASYQIKNGKIYGAFRVMSFIDMDFIGTITVESYWGKTVSLDF